MAVSFIIRIGSEGWSVRPQVADRGSPVDMGCQVIMRIAWPWSLAGNMLGESHAPCKLSTSYVDFEKEWLHRFRYKRLVFRPYPILHFFFSGIKCYLSGSPIHPLLLYSFYILCCTCSRAEYSWNLTHWTINQSCCVSIPVNGGFSFYKKITKDWRWQSDTGKPEVGKGQPKEKWQEDDNNVCIIF